MSDLTIASLAEAFAKIEEHDSKYSIILSRRPMLDDIKSILDIQYEPQLEQISIK